MKNNYLLLLLLPTCAYMQSTPPHQIPQSQQASQNHDATLNLIKWLAEKGSVPESLLKQLSPEQRRAIQSLQKN